MSYTDKRYGHQILRDGKPVPKRALNDADSSISLRREVSGVPRSMTWREKRNQVRLVYKTLQSLRAHRCRVGTKTYTAAIILLSRYGHPAKALDMWEEMKQERVYPNAEAYEYTLVAAAGRDDTGDLPADRALVAAKAVWAEMRADGLRPTTKAYNALIHAHQKAGMGAKALLLGEAMGTDRVDPNQHTYSALLLACSKEGQIEQIIQDMARVRVSPNTTIMNAGIRSCSGDYRMAEKLFEHFRDQGVAPDTATLNTFTRCYRLASVPKRAFRLVAAAAKVTEPKPPPWDSYTYNSLIACCGMMTARRWDRHHERAALLGEHARVSGHFTMRTAVALARVHAKYQLLDEVLKLYRSAEFTPRTERTMLEIIAALHAVTGEEVPRHMAEKLRGIETPANTSLADFLQQQASAFDADDDPPYCLTAATPRVATASC
ncbi:Pentatricopeptide repeat-containing protein [Diplonema papillatum]|nr:Pentatricopeptide repeat-containing protein [Diplonema papillatum]